MGFEYRFILGAQCIENLSRQPDGINTIDSVLRSTPLFLQMDVPNIYTFASGNSKSEKWLPTIHTESDSFILCLYSRSRDSDDFKLLNYLMHEFLDRCGSICVEEV